jgi:hypothetical protein
MQYGDVSKKFPDWVDNEKYAHSNKQTTYTRWEAT